MEERWAWAGAVAALLAPAGAALANWWTRKGAKEKLEGDWRVEREKALFDRQEHVMDAAHRRNAELVGEIARLEEDRDRGWGLARAWFDRAHDARHAHINTIQVAAARDPALLDRTPAALPPFTAIASKGADP